MSGSKSNQTNSAWLVHEHMWCLPSSLGDFRSSMFGHFRHHRVSLLAPFLHLCSPLASGEFPTVACVFLVLLPLVPQIWQFKNQQLTFYAILSASTSLQCCHLFWNICICIYIRTSDTQSSFYCFLKQEQVKYCETIEQRSKDVKGNQCCKRR